MCFEQRDDEKCGQEMNGDDDQANCETKGKRILLEISSAIIPSLVYYAFKMSGSLGE